VRFNTEIYSNNNAHINSGTDLLIASDSRRPSSFTAGVKVRFQNIQSKGYLYSHFIKSGVAKNAYEVTLAKPLQPEYVEWVVINENGDYINHNDIVKVTNCVDSKIEHPITSNKLCAIRNPFTKVFEVCCVSRAFENSNDQWRLLYVAQELSLKVA